MNLTLMVLIAVLATAACTSPETTRTRGGGQGADIGNRSDVVRMHEGSRPYEGTPRIISAEHPSLESARHASQFNRK
jgi:hypothetical protein